MSHVTWHNACRICKDEACESIDKLLDNRVADNIRDACRYLSEQLDGEISTEAFRRMYYRHRKREQPKEPTINERLARGCKYVTKLMGVLNRTKETIDEGELSVFIKTLKDALSQLEGKDD